jgi:hypothetical protein
MTAIGDFKVAILNHIHTDRAFPLLLKCLRHFFDFCFDMLWNRCLIRNGCVMLVMSVVFTKGSIHLLVILRPSKRLLTTSVGKRVGKGFNGRSGHLGGKRNLERLGKATEKARQPGWSPKHLSIFSPKSSNHDLNFGVGEKIERCKKLKGVSPCFLVAIPFRVILTPF